MDDQQYIPAMYGKVIKERKDDIVGICLVPPVPYSKPMIKSYIKFIKRHYILYGMLGLFKKILQQINYKILGKLSIVLKFERPYSISALAKKYKIPIYREKNVNDPKFIDIVRSLGPDLVSCASPQIVKSGLLSIPETGCINVHSSLLPKYRGVYPMFWVLLNGEEKTGVTVHFMDEKIDNGRIIAQKSFKIAKNDTFESLYQKAIEIIPDLFLESIKKIEKKSQLIENDESEATYYSYPRTEDIKKFKRIGKKMV